jgi:hypothetical protein
MSCDWNIYCKTCGSWCCFADANHALELMRHLIAHSGAIAGIADLCDDNKTQCTIKLLTSYGSVDASWFKAHLGHEVVPRNEYGGWDEEEHRPQFKDGTRVHVVDKDLGIDVECVVTDESWGGERLSLRKVRP